ncbi:MAG: twin-arginine translocase subunit TatC [Micromonosporaceae bacterium]|nr:twin-arginine translocase subunit TatC [Micromonosporaceae bacterium]
MRLVVRRSRKTQFQRAAEGSMTLMDHLRELRSRLFKAVLAIAVGFAIGFWLSNPIKSVLQRPYCDYMTSHHHLTAQGTCPMLMLDPTAGLQLSMQVALWAGLILAAPIWLYQLWAFIAPGLHKHERRWAYWFAGIAAPLFVTGALLAYLVIGRGLQFLLSFAGSADVNLEITRYFDFVTGLILLFGLAFEFPLVVVLFNIAGIASYQRLLGWWRIAVFVFFLFAGVAIPTGDPFSMIALGAGLTALYFGAVLFAYLNDRRRERRRRALYGDVADDEISPLDLDAEPIAAGEPVVAPEPVQAPGPLARRYDDVT